LRHKEMDNLLFRFESKISLKKAMQVLEYVKQNPISTSKIISTELGIVFLR